MTVVDFNKNARRVTVAAHVAELVPIERENVRRVDDICGQDPARLARLTKHMGDVSLALMYATEDLADPLCRLQAAVQDWLEQLMEERAR